MVDILTFDGFFCQEYRPVRGSQRQEIQANIDAETGAAGGPADLVRELWNDACVVAVLR
ncbi:MAG: hypothetical protein WB760_32530 [Xanthobacteraceae bacterium]